MYLMMQSFDFGCCGMIGFLFGFFVFPLDESLIGMFVRSAFDIRFTFVQLAFPLIQAMLGCRKMLVGLG